MGTCQIQLQVIMFAFVVEGLQEIETKERGVCVLEFVLTFTISSKPTTDIFHVALSNSSLSNLCSE